MGVTQALFDGSRVFPLHLDPLRPVMHVLETRWGTLPSCNRLERTFTVPLPSTPQKLNTRAPSNLPSEGSLTVTVMVRIVGFPTLPVV